MVRDSVKEKQRKDTGEAAGETVVADVTVTMGYPKVGLLAEAAREYVGSVEVIDIGIPDRLAAQVAGAVRTLRQADLLKPPGVAETIDWATALQLVGARHLDVDSAAATLGAVLKYREDADRVRKQLDTLLAS